MIIKTLKLQLANILTLINMTLGLISILLSIKEDFILSAIIILIAALTDRFDGLVARKLNIESKFGKFLDSNSDLISFGIAPGLLIYLSILYQFNIFGIIISFLFIMAGALRLARYNSVEFKGFYEGVPITIAGAFLALSIFALPYISAWIFIIITLTLTYLMVSRHSIKKI